MKRIILSSAIISLLTCLQAQTCFATGLVEVYNQALKSDPTFQTALAQRMATEESLPQAQAAIFPTLGFESTASIAKTTTTGMSSSGPQGKNTTRGIDFNLNLTQSIFNWTSWKSISAAKNTVKAALATYNSAAQNLMQRVVQAYFSVLQNREILHVTEVERRALYNQYLQTNESFKVGLKTITDVYDAKAAFSQSDARYIEAQNNLANSKEDLRAITGVYYNDLDWLRQDFPLVSPKPTNIDKWVQTATQQNWGLQAAKYGTLAAHDQISAAQGGHLPTLNLSAGYDNSYNRTLSVENGNLRQKGPTAGLTLAVPIYSGGLISSKVRQSEAQYQQASSQQEQIYRATINTTRKSYLGVLSGIKQIKADKETVQSAKSALEGTQEGYKVGINTIVDVLTAEQTYYEAQRSYAIDRFGYVNNLIGLKMAAGTLSDQDILDIDRWLGKTSPAKK